MQKRAIANLQSRALPRAAAMVRDVCIEAGEPSMIDDLRAEFDNNGITAAVQNHDTACLYERLVEGISYQGIADAVAEAYIDDHGSIGSWDVERSLAKNPACPKLRSYWHFTGCGYRKGLQRCNEPKLRRTCPLPTFDLRNGSLNQATYSLFLFMRDIAGGDFVGWLDRQLGAVDLRSSDAMRQLRDAVVMPMRHIHGVSDKVLNMTLASLLLAGDPARRRWVHGGAGMIAIDTLVHNWFHRTGILARLKADHPYGSICYRPGGCADIIERIALITDARQFNPEFPAVFPRYLQAAIWRFCAQQQRDQCNGNQIDDRHRCDRSGCSLFRRCDRVALKPGAG